MFCVIQSIVCFCLTYHAFDALLSQYFFYLSKYTRSTSILYSPKNEISGHWITALINLGSIFSLEAVGMDAAIWIDATVAIAT